MKSNNASYLGDVSWFRFSKDPQLPHLSDRLTTAISTQTGWQGLEHYLLNTPAWVAEGNQPAYTSIDAYAVTGYFSGKLGHPGNAETVRSWLKDPDGGFGKAIQQLKQGGLLPSNGDRLESA